MKKLNIIYTLPVAACLMLFGSCSNEDYLGGHVSSEGSGTLMNVTAQFNEVTGGKTFASGDYISITTSYANHDMTARNRKYVLQDDGRSFLADNELPIYVKGTTNILAYYPYSGEDYAEPTLTLNAEDQNNPQNLWLAKLDGVSPADAGSVNLDFKPALATLNIHIDAPGETISRYTLSGFAKQCGVDLYTFAVSPALMEDYAGGNSDDTDVFTAVSLIVVPQEVSNGTLTLKGTQRSYTLALEQIALGLGETAQLNVSISNGVATYEFIPGVSPWNDFHNRYNFTSGSTPTTPWSNSGLGGNVSSN